jgi:hypothetical protein
LDAFTNFVGLGLHFVIAFTQRWKQAIEKENCDGSDEDGSEGCSEAKA